MKKLFGLFFIFSLLGCSATNEDVFPDADASSVVADTMANDIDTTNQTTQESTVKKYMAVWFQYCDNARDAQDPCAQFVDSAGKHCFSPPAVYISYESGMTLPFDACERIGRCESLPQNTDGSFTPCSAQTHQNWCVEANIVSVDSKGEEEWNRNGDVKRACPAME